MTYAHLAVSPREIVEADAIDWRTGTAAIVITRKELDEETKETVYVDEGKKIYESVRKEPQFETIMRLLRQSELLSYEGNETIELVFVPKDSEGNELNVTKGCHAVDPVQRRFRGRGNLPLLCKQNEKKKRNYYQVEIGKKVKDAFGRQKDLPECLQQDQSNYNFLPYMNNVLVMDWFSILETHLFRINCSNYGIWNMLRFQKNRPVGMEGLGMEDIMHAIFNYSANETKLKDEEENRETEAECRIERAENGGTCG